jgi:transposase
MAQMMRVGLYRPVHVKTLRSQKLRMLLTHRKLLQSKAIAIENDLRGTLRNFGLKVGIAGWTRFEALLYASSVAPNRNLEQAKRIFALLINSNIQPSNLQRNLA